MAADSGFRNIPVHRYFGVDSEIVRDVISSHLPPLKVALTTWRTGAGAAAEFVPADFEPPRSFTTNRFVLTPLGPEHNVSDHQAWTSSIDHIRATPGYPDGNWPPLGGMTLEENLADLTRHAEDFQAGKGFTFTVLDPNSDEVIGCVYLYPPEGEGDVIVQSWVRADRAELDGPLADAVAAWLVEAWPWTDPDRCGR